MTCGDCRFWRNGDCRRRAPVVITDGYEAGGAGILSVFPQIDDMGWCGEFEGEDNDI